MSKSNSESIEKYRLLARAEKAEAERDRLRARVEVLEAALRPWALPDYIESCFECAHEDFDGFCRITNINVEELDGNVVVPDDCPLRKAAAALAGREE